MNFAHVLRTPDEEIVQLPIAKAVTEEEVFFFVTRKTYMYDEICSTAVTFENSVSEEHRLFVNEADCIDDLEDGPSNDTECESESQLQDYTDAIYVDKRLRRTRGNRYHAVLSSLLNNWYFIDLRSQKRTLSLKQIVRPQLKQVKYAFFVFECFGRVLLEIDFSKKTSQIVFLQEFSVQFVLILQMTSGRP